MVLGSTEASTEGPRQSAVPSEGGGTTVHATLLCAEVDFSISVAHQCLYLVSLSPTLVTLHYTCGPRRSGPALHLSTCRQPCLLPAVIVKWKTDLFLTYLFS